MAKDEYAGTFNGSWREFMAALTGQHLPIVRKTIKLAIERLKEAVADNYPENDSEWQDESIKAAKEKMIPYLEKSLTSVSSFAKTLQEEVIELWPERDDYLAYEGPNKAYEVFIFDAILNKLWNLFEADPPADY